MVYNNNKPKSNYMDTMIAQYGENWIVSMTPEDIQRSARRLIKEMVRGYMDYEKYGKYFLDTKFLDNIIVAVNNEYELSSLHYNALCLYRNCYPNIPNLSIHVNHDYALMQIYGTVLQKLNMVKQDNNIGWLMDTAALLNQYKFHLT